MNGSIHFSNFTELMHFLQEYSAWDLKTEFEITVRNHHDIMLVFVPKEAA
jgi:hypothetical protein